MSKSMDKLSQAIQPDSAFVLNPRLSFMGGIYRAEIIYICKERA